MNLLCHIRHGPWKKCLLILIGPIYGPKQKYMSGWLPINKYTRPTHSYSPSWFMQAFWWIRFLVTLTIPRCPRMLRYCLLVMFSCFFSKSPMWDLYDFEQNNSVQQEEMHLLFCCMFYIIFANVLKVFADMFYYICKCVVGSFFNTSDWIMVKNWFFIYK